MDTQLLRTPIVAAAAITLALAWAGCSHVQTHTAPVVQAPTLASEPGFVKGSPRGARAALENIADARTEREAINAVVDYALWALADTARTGLENHGVIVRAIRANPYLRDPQRVVDHFFAVGSVWPDNCSPEAHVRLKQRIEAMTLVARACGQHGLLTALQKRHDLVMGSRARMDAHGICLGL